MDIFEFQKEKQKFENDIFNIVQNRLDEFISTTGIVPYDISIRCAQSQVIGDKYVGLHVVCADVVIRL